MSKASICIRNRSQHVRFVLGIAITITVPVVLYPSQHLRGLFKTQSSFCLAIRSPHLFLGFKNQWDRQIGLQGKHRKTRHSSRSTTWTATGSFDRCRTAGLGRLSSVVWPVQTKCMNVTSRQSYILQVHISIWYQYCWIMASFDLFRHVADGLKESWRMNWLQIGMKDGCLIRQWTHWHWPSLCRILSVFRTAKIQMHWKSIILVDHVVLSKLM